MPSAVDSSQGPLLTRGIYLGRGEEWFGTSGSRSADKNSIANVSEPGMTRISCSPVPCKNIYIYIYPTGQWAVGWSAVEQTTH